MQIKGVGRKQVRKLHTAYHQHVGDGPCVTGAIVKGLSAVMPEQPALTEEHQVESVREYMQIVTAARDIIRQWRRYKSTGILTADQNKLADEAAFVIQTARYALRLWTAEGAWTGYFQVRGGVIHNCMGCRTIDPVHTHFVAVLDLTGRTVDEVIAKGYRMCSHCRKRPNGKIVWKVERMIAGLCSELEEIASALREEVAG